MLLLGSTGRTRRMQLRQSSPNVSWRRKYTKVLSGGGAHFMKLKDQSKQMPAGKEAKE